MNQVKDFIEYIVNAIKIWVIVQPWEAGIRVRFGKKVKKLSKGIYFKIPYFDSVYVQETRLRVCSMPVQTISTKDNKTITINGAVGYLITDVEKLYKTLFHPETTITNMCMSYIAEYVNNNNTEDLSGKALSENVLKELEKLEYGIKFEYFKVTSFAVVRTYRLIQDYSWTDENLKMDKKK